MDPPKPVWPNSKFAVKLETTTCAGPELYYEKESPKLSAQSCNLNLAASTTMAKLFPTKSPNWSIGQEQQRIDSAAAEQEGPPQIDATNLSPLPSLSWIVDSPCRWCHWVSIPMDNPGSQVAFQAADAKNTRPPPTTALRERSGRSDRHSKKYWQKALSCVFCELHNLNTDWLNAIVLSLHVLDCVLWTQEITTCSDAAKQFQVPCHTIHI